jgi:hypothetical protein
VPFRELDVASVVLEEDTMEDSFLEEVSVVLAQLPAINAVAQTILHETVSECWTSINYTRLTPYFRPGPGHEVLRMW